MIMSPERPDAFYLRGLLNGLQVHMTSASHYLHMATVVGKHQRRSDYEARVKTAVWLTQRFNGS